MHGFTSRIAEINLLAESAPGFVWRWTDSDNGPFNGADLLFNLCWLNWSTQHKR